MADSDTPVRITLRALPLPAKLVLSVFLIAVGLGYFSAMVQLHMKHSKKDGEPLPTGADVVEVFAGLKLFDPNEPVPCSRIDTLLSGDATAPDVSKDNMAPAFFAKSKGWTGEQAGRRVDGAALQAERAGELQAMLAWVRSDPAAKKAAYEADAFPMPGELNERPLTKSFLAADGAVKIKSMVDARCMNCHNNQAPALDTYADLAPLIDPPSQLLIDGKWVKSSRQTSVEHLTQSTHAHLLTFAILFAFTGLAFSFTTYWTGLRMIVAPMVLLAQVADISFWWLARVPQYGPYFAYGILGTGAVVGIGLCMHIVLSLLNMYGIKGKLMALVVLFGLALAVSTVGLKVIQPALDDERKQAEADKKLVKEADKTKKVIEQVKPVTKAESSHLEKILSGPRVANKDFPFNGKGTMVPAFFGKDSSFNKQVKANPEKKPALETEREGEQQALLAWINAEPAAREKAFNDDSFVRPVPLAKKPITPEYLDEAKAVKVKSILLDRCARCHCSGGEQEDYPLETYEQLQKYLVPAKK